MTFTKIGTCHIDSSARVCSGAVIGKPFRPLMGFSTESSSDITTIGSEAYVGYYSVVGSGTVIESRVILDDFSIIECEVLLGNNTLVIYRAQICNEARIGRDCVIGGFVAERVVVGDRSRVFGKIVHSQHNPSIAWDAPEAEEGSAVIGEDVFIGFDTLVIGEITVGAGAYICTGSIVTRDVPPQHVAYGVNKKTPYSEWPGALRHSPFFQQRQVSSKATRNLADKDS